MIKMQRSLLLPYALVAAGVFYLAYSALGIDNLIITLNGMLIGALASVTITYSRVIRSWFWGDRPTDGVSVFGLFFMILWFVIGLFILNSVYVRSADLPNTTLLTTALGRYAMIICAWGLIGSLDYGEAWYFGRDRKQLFLGLIVGTIIAAVLIYAQQFQVLAP